MCCSQQLSRAFYCKSFVFNVFFFASCFISIRMAFFALYCKKKDERKEKIGVLLDERQHSPEEFFLFLHKK